MTSRRRSRSLMSANGLQSFLQERGVGLSEVECLDAMRSLLELYGGLPTGSAEKELIEVTDRFLQTNPFAVTPVQVHTLRGRNAPAPPNQHTEPGELDLQQGHEIGEVQAEGNMNDGEEEEEPIPELFTRVLKNITSERSLASALRLLDAICSPNSLGQTRQLFVEAGIVPVIVNLIEKDGSVLEYAMKIVRSLSLVQTGRSKLVECDAVPKLVKLISCESEEVRCCALRTTFNLSVMNVQIRQNIVNAGALPLLLDASLEESEGRCAAIGTLANLATETDIKRSIVQKHNGLERLLSLLRLTDESILTHACRALFAIAANDENKIAIADAGGLPLLLNCMDWPVDSVRMNAAGALANLAIHPANKLKLVQHGALPKLRNMASSSNPKIQRQVARCLFALAAHVENRKSIIEENCLTALVRLLNSNNPDVQLNAAGAIGNIAMTDEYKIEVVHSGALDRLVTLSGWNVHRVQRQAARAIFTLTAKDVAKTKLAELGGLEKLIVLTKSNNEDIQRDAAGALANMAIGTDHKDTIVQKDGLKPLLHLLTSRNVAVQRQSARAIFALAGTPSNQERIIQEDGLKPLVELLDSSNDEVQKHACGAIANISNRHPEEVIRLGALVTLVQRVLDHPNLEVRRQAARAVYNLSPGKQRMQMMLSPYAGVGGEQQRVRHDMRALYQVTYEKQALFRERFLVEDCENAESDIELVQEAVECEFVNRSKRSRISSFGDSCTPVLSRKSLSNSQTQGGGTAALTRSQNAIMPLVSSSSSSSSSVVGPVQTISVDPRDEDVNMTVSEEPPASVEDWVSGDMCMDGKNSRKRPCEDNGADSLVYLDRQQKKKKQKTKNKAQRFAFDPDIQISLCLKEVDEGDCTVERNHGELPRMEFFGHAAVLGARWPLLRQLIKESGREPNDDEMMLIRVPEEHCYSRVAWLSLLEYLYTDSVRVNASQIKESVTIAAELADLAYSFQMLRLCCFCLELNSKVEQLHPVLKLKDLESRRASSWVEDMSRLLESAVDRLGIPQKKYQCLHQFSDMEFRTTEEGGLGSVSVAAHKVLLSSRCSYFEAQFGSSRWRDSSSTVVDFAGSAAALGVILRYLYCGVDRELSTCLNSDPSLALEVLVLANQYTLDGLQLHCEAKLLDKINRDNVVVLLQELDLVHAPLLRSVCVHFAIQAMSKKISDDECQFCPEAALEMPWKDLGSQLLSEIERTAAKWGFSGNSDVGMDVDCMFGAVEKIDFTDEKMM